MSLLRLRAGWWSARDTRCRVMEVKGPLPSAGFARPPTCGLLQGSAACPYPGDPLLAPLRELRAAAGITFKAPQIPADSQPWERGDGMKCARALPGFGREVALALNLLATGAGCGAAWPPGGGRSQAVFLIPAGCLTDLLLSWEAATPCFQSLRL